MVQSLIKTLNHKSTHSEDISCVTELCDGGDINRLVGFCLVGCFILFFPLLY